MDKEILFKMVYNKLTKVQKKQYKNSVEPTFKDDELMTDQEVMSLLQISQRTLYTWRKKGAISYFKIQSRYYYLKTLLFADFIKIYND